MSVDYSTLPSGSAIHHHNAKIFDDLSDCIKENVDRVVKKRTKKMRDALRYRQFMLGGGKFPIGLPKGGSRSSEGHAADAWEMRRKKSGRYILVNEHRNSDDGYAYVKNLMYGTGWSARVSSSNDLKRLVRKGGRLFSTQLPNGITPFVRRHREKLEDEIKITTDICAAKGK